MAHKIRLGFVGANVRSNWATQSHFPALLASPDVELTAVCTTRPESAEEAREAFGAKLAFHDFRAGGEPATSETRIHAAFEQTAILFREVSTAE